MLFRSKLPPKNDQQSSVKRDVPAKATKPEPVAASASAEEMDF